MKKNKFKILLVAFLIVACGLLWLFWGKEGQRQTITDDSLFLNSNEPDQSEVPSRETGEKIYIHIVGAVKNPGVYTFEKEPRVIEVVKAAGGFTKKAVRSGVNQAELVADGVRIVIESKKDRKTKRAEKGQQVTSDKIDLNLATKEELMTLPGIGESKAMAILSYRETKGRFMNVEDIMNITGIKSGVFDKIKDYIQV